MNIHLCSIFPVTTRHPSLYHVPSIFFSWCASTHGFNIISSCVYTGSVASISSCASVTHQRGVLCDVQVLGAKLYQDFSVGLYKYLVEQGSRLSVSGS